MAAASIERGLSLHHLGRRGCSAGALFGGATEMGGTVNAIALCPAALRARRLRLYGTVRPRRGHTVGDVMLLPPADRTVGRRAARLLSRAELRRRIDTAVVKALADSRFAEDLVANPTVVLGNARCIPQQRLQLRPICAQSIKDFACQAEALFWPPRQPPNGGQLPAGEDKNLALAVGL